MFDNLINLVAYLNSGYFSKRRLHYNNLPILERRKTHNFPTSLQILTLYIITTCKLKKNVDWLSIYLYPSEVT